MTREFINLEMIFETMKEAMKKIWISVLGLLQGTFGSYLALVGYALAFPGTSPDSKDYEEDMFTAPIGYVIMLLWMIVMVTAIMYLRRKKSSLITFLISWLIGTAGIVIWIITAK